MTPEDEKIIIELLNSRDGTDTNIHLFNGVIINVFNIAWGYDMSDEFAHITTNINPEPVGADYSIDFIYTNQIKKIVNPANNLTLYEVIPHKA